MANCAKRMPQCCILHESKPVTYFTEILSATSRVPFAFSKHHYRENSKDLTPHHQRKKAIGMRGTAQQQ
eukprot:1144598-Pelagomonas_calceolata.AAC.8